MSKPRLVIGNKNYSSWSLRAWIALRKAGVAFQELRLPLDTPQFYEAIGDYSPTLQVPVLWDGSSCVWDSLAIAEYVNDRWAGGSLWPQNPQARGRARAFSAEMHAGFPLLRQRMPMNCRASERVVPVDADLEQEISRIVSIWRQCRESCATSAPWLFGEFSIADAMYIPVALRFNSYEVQLPELALEYLETVLHDPDICEWMRSAREETEVVEADEAGV